MRRESVYFILMVALLLLFPLLAVADEAPAADAQWEAREVDDGATAVQTLGTVFETLWYWIEPTHTGIAQTIGDTNATVELLSRELVNKPGWGSIFADGYFDPDPSGGGLSVAPDAVAPAFVGCGVYREKFVAVVGAHIKF